MSELTGQVQNASVQLFGSVAAGSSSGTTVDTEEIVQQVIESMPTVSAIDFTNFENGTFTEAVDGSVVSHAVTFDDSGRPTAIDDIVITWGDA